MCVQCVGMCSYCDCRSLPVVSRLSREHGEILELAGRLGRAVAPIGDGPARGASPEAFALADELLTRVAEHGAYEERSLYHELREECFFERVSLEMCGEHRSIYARLQRAIRLGLVAETLLPALDRLRGHVMKEERGLFPPAVILLSASAWERAAAAT